MRRVGIFVIYKQLTREVEILLRKVEEGCKTFASILSFEKPNYFLKGSVGFYIFICLADILPAFFIGENAQKKMKRRHEDTHPHTYV